MPQIQSAVTIIDLGGIKLDIPDPGGIFSGGLLSGIGSILVLAFGITLIVWIAVSILAGIKVIQSQGNPDKIQEGMKKIKYVWISVSVLFIFFVLVTLAGVIFGYGGPDRWANTLAQCGGYDGPFYFAQVDQQTDYYSYKYSIDVGGKDVYCCYYDPGSNDLSEGDTLFGNASLNAMGINTDRVGNNWIVMGDTALGVDAAKNLTYNGSSNVGFTRCDKAKIN